MLSTNCSYVRFSYKLHNDMDYGTYHPQEKKLTGAIASLVNNTEDMAIGNFVVTYSREQFINHLIPITWSRQYMVFHKVDSADHGLSNYTREFKPSVWYLVFISLVVCALVLWFITTMNPGETVVDKSDLSLFVVETLCNNSGATSIDFKSNSGRILSFTLFVITMLFYIHYTSFLVSCLTVSKEKIPFTNFQELYAKKNTYSILWVVNSSVHRTLKDANSDIGQKISREMQHRRSGNILFPEALHILKTENSVMILTKAAIMSLGWQSELSKFPLQKFILTSWPIRKDAIYVDILNYYFFRCLETGIYRRLEEKWKKILKINKVDDVISSQPMSLKNVMFPFTVVGIGLVASFLILIVEVIIKRHGIRTAVDSYSLTPQLSH